MKLTQEIRMRKKRKKKKTMRKKSLIVNMELHVIERIQPILVNSNIQRVQNAKLHKVCFFFIVIYKINFKILKNI